MTTRFLDEVNTHVPLHWWRWTSATPATEADVGTDPGSIFASASGTYAAQQAGFLEVTETSYSLGLTDGYFLRSVDLTSDDFGGLSEGTIICFFDTTAGTQQYMFGTHPDNYQFSVYVMASGAIRLQIIEATQAVIFTTTPTGYNDGSPHMLAITCDGASTNRFFIDGQEVAIGTSSTGLSTNRWIDGVISGAPFTVGNDSRGIALPGGSNDLPFTGNFGELIFFAGPLSATAIADIYAASQPFVPPPSGTGGHRYRGRRTFVGF